MNQRTRARAVDDLTVIHHRKVRQHFELAGWRSLCTLLVVVDGICGIYFMFTPTSVFRTSTVWSGILQITGTLAPVGLLFAIVTVVGALGLIVSHWVLRFAFLLALVPWGAMVGSFVYAAWTLAGLGTLTATLSAVALILHLASVGHFPSGHQPSRR